MSAFQELLKTFEKNRDRTFLIEAETGRSLTFGELYKTSCAFSESIQKVGLKRGDRVAVILNNAIETAVVYYGCLYAGIVVVPVNPAYSTGEIEYILGHSGVAAVFCSDETHPIVRNVEVARGVLLLNVSRHHRAQGCADWDIADLDLLLGDVSPRDVSDEEAMVIIYTSGTTARPKGVTHRISSLIRNAAMFTTALKINEKNRFYGILPMTYLGGYYNLLLLPSVAGASVVLVPGFDAKTSLNFWKDAVCHSVNTLWLVPTIVSILLRMDRGQDGERFCREQVKCALIGTAPLPVALRKRFEERYGVSLLENYALSETLFLTSHLPGEEYPDGCVGKVLPGVELLITGDNGKPLPMGQEGEITVRTSSLMAGYYDDATRTPAPISTKDGFKTGDVGILNDKNELFVTGRKKDLIIRGGFNVSPMAIEEVLHQHPAVEQAVVVGVPHDILGEDIIAVVKIRAGHTADESLSTVREFCKERLGPQRQIGLVFAIDEFPLGTTGKILKRRVKEIVMEKLNLPGTVVSSSAKPESTLVATGSLPLISGRVKKDIVRPDPALVKELSLFPTTIVSDCLNRLCAMDGRMMPIVRSRPFCGPAVTVEEVEGGNLMSHIALDLIKEGDVLVIDAKGSLSRSCWGGIQTLKAKTQGAAAVVIFGALRDHQEIVDLGLPVYALGVSPAGPLKGWGGNVNVPIACAGVVVNPGDIVLGDDDGVVVVPADLAAQVPPMCKARLEKEQEWAAKVKEGASTLDAVNLREQVKKLNIRIS